MVDASVLGLLTLRGLLLLLLLDLLLVTEAEDELSFDNRLVHGVRAVLDHALKLISVAEHVGFSLVQACRVLFLDVIGVKR